MKKRTELMRSSIPSFSSGPDRSNIITLRTRIPINSKYNIIMWAYNIMSYDQNKSAPAQRATTTRFDCFRRFWKTISYIYRTPIQVCNNIQDDSFIVEHSKSIRLISTEEHRVLCDDRITLYTKCDDPPPTTSSSKNISFITIFYSQRLSSAGFQFSIRRSLLDPSQTGRRRQSTVDE